MRRTGSRSKSGGKPRRVARAGAVPTLRHELQLHYLLFQLSNKLRLILLDAIRPHGMTVPRYRALQQLYDHGGLRLTDLAAECAIEQSAMTHVVTQLVRVGLATRDRSVVHIERSRHRPRATSVPSGPPRSNRTSK